jgi:hydrogenase maturation protein HypF
MLKTYKISISGQVQGVGFRPYVYNLATEYSLKGTVSNDENGVAVFVTGVSKSINDFYTKLIKSPPPLAKILESNLEEISAVNFEGFKIIPSEVKGGLNLPLTPDFAICNKCKEEIENTSNKRFNYAFTTCVNCGPRWSITKTFPFERNHTSIDEFQMCERCEYEFRNPTDRRFHSQTNTCSTCGINLKLIDSKGEVIESINGNIFKNSAQILSKNKIVAIKNTNGYLLCCNAENKEVVKKLRAKKNRPNKPFAVLYPSLELLKNEVEISSKQKQLLNSPVSPIVITSLNNFSGKIVLKDVAPGLSQIGVMLPNSGILQLLCNELDFPIIATSGNIHGSPIISNNVEAVEKLKNVADYFLQHNLEITHSQDDSVIKFSNKFKQEVLFRRSRGLAPNFWNVEVQSNEKIMAM